MELTRGRYAADVGAHVSRSFDDLLRKRLETSRGEASRQVLAAARAGRPLSTAILDVIEELPMRSTKELRAWVADIPMLFAEEIYKNAGAYVRSFNGTMYEITNPYVPGKHRVRIEEARVNKPYEPASSRSYIEMIVSGGYVWVDEEQVTKTSFSFRIVMSPRWSALPSDIDVKLKSMPPSKIEDAPKEMVDGLRKALES